MKLFLLPAAFSFLLLPSCVTKFTAAERQTLSTVAILRTAVPADAYSEPYGGNRDEASTASRAAVTSGTGALGPVVASLVGAAITATQNNMFRGENKKSFAAVQKNTPDVGKILNKKLESGVRAEPFYGSKVRDSSPNSITSEITSYRLVRIGENDDGELLLTPEMVVEMGLTDGSGKKMAGGSFVGIGLSHPISVYASSAAKTKEGYESAAKNAVDQFTTLLARKAFP